MMRRSGKHLVCGARRSRHFFPLEARPARLPDPSVPCPLFSFQDSPEDKLQQPANTGCIPPLRTSSPLSLAKLSHLGVLVMYAFLAQDLMYAVITQ